MVHRRPITLNDAFAGANEVMGGFDFTTTFLHAHSWLNWVDEDDDDDEVGLKEKPDKKMTSK